MNVVKIDSERIKTGFNSDYFGFRKSLESWLGHDISKVSALILGSGGASKAVKAVCDDCNIDYKVVSRTYGKGDLTYGDLIHEPDIVMTHTLIINTTPLGMYPLVNEAPNLPYHLMNESFYLYDLIYNPEKTLFMERASSYGANTKNGLEMLVLQAERSWEIWNNQY